MDKSSLAILLMGIIGSFLLGQNAAWENIGNRSYSTWYETHFLIEKTGFCKWIYFKPKHFGRYTLFEVSNFFLSFLLPFLFGVFALLLSTHILSKSIFNAIIGVSFLLVFISGPFICILNEIGSHKDEKKRFYLEGEERAVADVSVPLPDKIKHKKTMDKVLNFYIKSRNNPFFTIYNLRDSYHTRIKKAKDNLEKIEKINLKYIEYFKNVEKLVVIKENKDGTLVFKK